MSLYPIKVYAIFQALIAGRVFTMEYVDQTNFSNDKRAFREEIETYLSSKDGISIFVHAWVPYNPRRALVCIQGLGGHGGYYRELASQEGMSDTLVVAPDLRGHGHSGGVRGDIDRFSCYVLDVEVAVSWVRTMWPYIPIFMLGESMGASIAIQYVAYGLYRTNQPLLAGLVLVSPVLSSSIRPTFVEVMHFIRSLLIAPTHQTIAVTGREELGCRDPAFNALLRADPLFVREVSAQFLTKLWIWLWQSKRKARQIKLPMLALLGGRDYVARHSGTSAFLRDVASRERRIVTFPQAYHCLFRDPDTPEVVKALKIWLTTQHGE